MNSKIDLKELGQHSEPDSLIMTYDKFKLHFGSILSELVTVYDVPIYWGDNQIKITDLEFFKIKFKINTFGIIDKLGFDELYS